MNIAVCGAGGFIGSHLTKSFASDPSNFVVALDIKPKENWFQSFDQSNIQVKDKFDLTDYDNCTEAVFDSSVVFNLACNMGGMGFIENHKALCMLSGLINTNLLKAIRNIPPGKSTELFFASSACVYAADKQTDPNNPGLKESDAYPAMPEDGYGWEKLFSERMCRHFTEDFGIKTYVARFHNVYGPYTSFAGGREKAPAAICRKVIEAKILNRNSIDIWGDGEQSRSFMYIDDCIEGIKKIHTNDVQGPINLGSSELVTINQLVDIVEEIAGIKLERKYILDAPLGVRGRSSDNTLIKETLGWEPSTKLKDGLELTYAWIYDNLINKTGQIYQKK